MPPKSTRHAVPRTCRSCGSAFSLPAYLAARPGGGTYCSRACRYAPRSIAWFLARGAVDPRTGCLEWTGHRDKDGYGRVTINRQDCRVHREIWQLVRGPIPQGYIVRHVVCDNPPCFNIDHLAVGIAVDNTADMVRKGRQVWPIGRRNGGAKLTEADVLAIRRACAEGISQHVLAKRYGISQQQISSIALRKRWRSVSGE